MLETKTFMAPASDEVARREIEQLPLSQRLGQWKQSILDATPIISAERARLVVESWKSSERDDLEIRRAKLLKTVLEGVPIKIHPWQLVVGGETANVIGGNPFIDFCGDYIPGLTESVDIAVGSPVVKGSISEDERKVLRECVALFKGKTLGDQIKKDYDVTVGSWYNDMVDAKAITAREKNSMLAHGVARWDVILSKGLRGIIDEAEAGIKQFNENRDSDVGKLYFWQAVIISCSGVIKFAQRYAELARKMAGNEPNGERRKELEEIARTCEWVPENPARTFREAVQAIVLVHIAAKLEKPSSALAMGRVDQYLWPYYTEDIQEGRLTQDDALDLIGSLYLYLSSLVSVWDRSYTEQNQNATLINNITVGGVNPQGEDATNTLTFLILHLAGLLRVPEPHISFRWHSGTPDWAMNKAIDTNVAARGGIPHFVNDAHVLDHLTKMGYPIDTVRDYYNEGCVYPMPSDKTWGRRAGTVNMAQILDVTLHNGIAPLSGKRIGLETGDPRNFKSFDDLLVAFKSQYEFIMKRLLWLGSMSWAAGPRFTRLPFMSSLLPDCLESGIDALSSTNFTTSVIDRAIVDATDSLVAIKDLVFDQKKLTMDELLNALDTNFDGERGEEIRLMCLAAPKFGNGIDEVDILVGELGAFSGSIAESDKQPDGVPWMMYRQGVAWHYFGGKGVGALSNGRKSGEPLNDGSFSPMRQADKSGPTAVLNSVLKAGFKESSMTVLNQRFSAATMQSAESRKKLAALTETFFRNGGQHVQYNLVDSKTLLDAQKQPDQYRDLVVRVGGFSAYFVQLTKEIQNDIIARTDHGF